MQRCREAVEVEVVEREGGVELLDGRLMLSMFASSNQCSLHLHLHCSYHLVSCSSRALRPAAALWRAVPCTWCWAVLPSSHTEPMTRSVSPHAGIISNLFA